MPVCLDLCYYLLWASRILSKQPTRVSPTASAYLADGKLDREKQDALYVRLGREGHVAKTPAQVKHEDAKAAMDIAGRMRYFVKLMLADNDVAGMEYDEIESVFKMKRKIRFISLGALRQRERAK